MFGGWSLVPGDRISRRNDFVNPMGGWVVNVVGTPQAETQGQNLKVRRPRRTIATREVKLNRETPRKGLRRESERPTNDNTIHEATPAGQGGLSQAQRKNRRQPRDRRVPSHVDRGRFRPRAMDFLRHRWNMAEIAGNVKQNHGFPKEFPVSGSISGKSTISPAKPKENQEFPTDSVGSRRLPQKVDDLQGKPAFFGKSNESGLKIMEF